MQVWLINKYQMKIFSKINKLKNFDFIMNVFEIVQLKINKIIV